MKISNHTKGQFFVTLLAFVLAGSVAYAATVSTAKQLEKGIQLYEQHQDDAAMDAFIDVLVNGSRAEVNEANKYINLIHSRVGGIQDPIEVDADYKEGEKKHLGNMAVDPAVLQEQLAAEVAPIEQEVADAGLAVTAQADEAAMVAQQKAQMAAELQQDLDAELAAQKAAAEEQAAARQAALQQQLAEQQAIAQEQARQHALAMQQDVPSVLQEEYEEQSASSSTFSDLTTSSAIRARQLYTAQKIESMKQTALAKLDKEKGVRVYFRNNLPDAIDIDSEVLFNGYKFRTEALPILDEVYTLMALTQGASYTILPPGSYTDNITLSGIRQAMALNSFLVHKGLSSGKISYNMGLYDQEPPAKYANLEGLSIVFDFEADLPASLPEAASLNKLPMLSMAVVPVNNQIDLEKGEAFAIDFSVIETENAIGNWLFQIVQHGEKDSYYVVRQLEGLAPVYHQLLWNGRKGVIGPELACGTYTLALTAVDVKGGKRTLRRQVEVLCNQTKKKAQSTTGDKPAKALNYKKARLWKKPARVMKAAAVVEQPEAEPEIVDPFASSTPQVPANTYEDNTLPAVAVPSQGMTNPYDMPYEEYGN